jgi:hypothetical protein
MPATAQPGRRREDSSQESPDKSSYPHRLHDFGSSALAGIVVDVGTDKMTGSSSALMAQSWGWISQHLTTPRIKSAKALPVDAMLKMADDGFGQRHGFPHPK